MIHQISGFENISVKMLAKAGLQSYMAACFNIQQAVVFG